MVKREDDGSEQNKECVILDEGVDSLLHIGSLFPGRFSSPVDAGDGDWFIASRGAQADGNCDVKVSLFLGELVVGMGHFMHTHFDQNAIEPVCARIQKLFNEEVGALVAYKDDGSWSWSTGVGRGEDLSESVKRLKPGEHLELHFYGGPQQVLSAPE